MPQPKDKNRRIGRPQRQSEDIDNPADIPLNGTEKMFVHQYLLTGDVKESARKIGSDAKDLTKAGSKILNRPNVRQAISLGQKEYIVQAAVEKSEIVIMLRKNWMLALDKGDIKAANEATKLLGQACPDMFHAPQKIDTPTETASKARNITDVQALDVFSTGGEAMDVDIDLDKLMSISKSSDLGSDEF